MKKAALLSGFFIFFILFLSSPGSAQENTRTGHTDEPGVNSSEIRIITFGISAPYCLSCIRKAELLYTEAFKRLGYGFAYKIYPPKRGLVESNSGRVDGEAYRLKFDKKMKEQFPNLICVEVPVDVGDVVAYSIKHKIHIRDWEDLRDKDYLIGYLRGAKAAEENLLKYVDKQDLIAITNSLQAIRMLVSGRIDILIESKVPFESILGREEFRDQDIRCIGTLDHLNLYPYLHNKHAELVPKLAAVLKAMKEDGSFEKLSEQAKKRADGE